MRRIFLTWMGAFILCFQASAKVETTQTLMPEGGQADLQVSAGYGASTSKFTGGKVEMDLMALSASLGYGVSEGHLLRAGLNYSSENTESTYLGTTTKDSQSGLSTLALGYQGRADADTMSFYYGLTYSLPVEEATADGVAPSQSHFNLALGGVFDASPIYVGFLMDYDYPLKGKFNDGAEDVHVEGGDSVGLTGFVEVQSPYHPNFSVSYFSWQGTKKTDSAGTTEDPDFSSLELSVSLRIDLQSNLQILPSLSYVNMLKKPDLLESSNGYGVRVLLRSLF